MERHPLQLVNLIAGALLIAVGVIVATFGVDQLANNAVAWASAVTAFLGLVLVVSSRRPRPAPATPEG